MNVELEERYFNWLYSRVVLEDNPSPSQRYYRLLGLLHKTKFIWTVLGDDNRAEYGKELRREFVAEQRIKNPGAGWLEETCSVLEMLIAFASIAEFETEKAAHLWFWVFLENLGLNEMNDASGFDEASAVTALNHFIFRKYAPNGRGGLFPLMHPKEDQREVEIWYQFCAYINERGEV